MSAKNLLRMSVLLLSCLPSCEPDHGMMGPDCTTDGVPAGTLVCNDWDGRLMWENSADDNGLDWDAAIAYCESLSLGGFGDWRLPSIDELRTFVRGNALTMPEGWCEVGSDCLDDSCGYDCGGRASGEGPGEFGCYWHLDAAGACETYWSSSEVTDLAGDPRAWTIMFRTGLLSNDELGLELYVRCVRDAE